jgi:3-oxoacid CoA-transferase
VLERAIRADVALRRAHRADRHGNLVFRRGARNFHPVFATGARCTIAEVDEVVEPGGLDAEDVVTPGIWVNRVVRTEHPLTTSAVRELTRRHGRVVEQEPRPGLGGLPPDLMARRAALCLRRGEYVNLGLGLPTLVSSYLSPDDGVTLHAENGMLGYGPLVEDGEPDVDLYNASGQLVRLLPGASFFDSATAHAMARGGRISTVILGAFEVSERGDLANWNVPSTGKGGIGGAMDLVSGGARVIVLTFHTTRDGASKLVPECRYPLTAPGCVGEVVTDMGYFTIERDGFILREIAPGVALYTVRAHTAGKLLVPLDLRAMTFG